MTELTPVTTEQPESASDEDEIFLPVYGLPGYRFLLIHVTALVSLAISILVSSAVLVYFNRPTKCFYSKPIGDRLVFYLALWDLLFSISHTMDHSFMVAVRGERCLCYVPRYINRCRMSLINDSICQLTILCLNIWN